MAKSSDNPKDSLIWIINSEKWKILYLPTWPVLWVKIRVRRTIGAKDKREVTSQKILKISFENIVAKLNK